MTVKACRPTVNVRNINVSMESMKWFVCYFKKYDVERFLKLLTSFLSDKVNSSFQVVTFKYGFKKGIVLPLSYLWRFFS